MVEGALECQKLLAKQFLGLSFSARDQTHGLVQASKCSTTELQPLHRFFFPAFQFCFFVL